MDFDFSGFKKIITLYVSKQIDRATFIAFWKTEQKAQGTGEWRKR